MRTRFPTYYQPSDAELKSIWQNALIVLDANVLLNLYRYSPDSGDQLFELLEQLKAQLWLPNQAALEFHRNRPGVILTAGKVYKATEQKVTKLLESFDKEHEHPFLSAKLAGEVRRILGALKDEMTAKHESHRSRVTTDPMLDRISTLFDGKVGDP